MPAGLAGVESFIPAKEPSKTFSDTLYITVFNAVGVASTGAGVPDAVSFEEFLEFDLEFRSCLILIAVSLQKFGANLENIGAILKEFEKSF